MVVMFLSVTVVTFIIFFVIPSEDDQASLGRGGTEVDVRTTVQIEGPIYEEYAEFLRKIVTQGSLGNSWVLRGQEVNELLVRAAPVTLSLVIGGALLWMLIAIPAGVLSALRPRSAFSRLTTVFVLIGISAHPLWIGLMLVVPRRRPAGPHADRRLLRGLQPGDELRRPGAVGVPPDPAVVHLRAHVRGDLHADDPREHARDAERGLRPHRARQGRARSGWCSARTCSATRCCPW